MSGETADTALPAGAHAEAASAFVERAQSRHGAALSELYVFGSTVRGEATGRASDVDILVVLQDIAKRDAVANSLRDIAYDVMLEYGPLVELHVLDEATFEQYRREGNPFVRNVIDESRSDV